MGEGRLDRSPSSRPLNSVAGERRLDRTLESDTTPADVETLTASALARHQAGQPEQAAELYDEVLALDQDNPTALYLSGLLAFETGRLDEAALRLQQLADLWPGHLQAQFALAGIRHQRGEYAAAAEAFRAVLRIDPDHAGARLGITETQRAAGDLDAALKEATAAIERLPQLAAAHGALGTLQALLGRPTEAAMAWREAVRLEPQASLTRVCLIFALVQAGQSEAAIAEAEVAIALDRRSAEAWFALGSAHAALDRHARAAEALETAVTLDPDRAVAHLSLGVAYLQLLRPQDAQRALERAIALEPRMAQAYVNLGTIHAVMDRPLAARRAYEMALEIEPELVEAHQRLAALFADMGDMESSRRHADRVFKKRSFFIEVAKDPLRRVLVLVNAGSGNVPFEHLLPKSRFTRIQHYVAYGQPERPDALPEYDVAFNAVGEPDKAHLAQANLEAFAQATRRPLLNAPAKVAGTARHLIAVRLARIPDVLAPATVRLGPADAADPGLAGKLETQGVTLPALARPIGSHGGLGLVLADTPQALRAFTERMIDDAYVTTFHDFRSADGLYRKYRTIFVDRRPYPYHLAISRHWMIHRESADMAEHAACVEEELSFLTDQREAIGERAMDAITAIGQLMDLDYAGVDFSILSDGRVLVFEANATMLVHPERNDGPFARKNPFVSSIVDAFEDMIARASP